MYHDSAGRRSDDPGQRHAGRGRRRCAMKAAERIVVDATRCKACGICVELCPREVFDAGRDGVPVVARLDDCTVCLFCEWHCPDFAVRVQLREPSSEPLSELATATGAGVEA